MVGDIRLEIMKEISHSIENDTNRIEVNFKNSLGQFEAKIEPSQSKAYPTRGDHQAVG